MSVYIIRCRNLAVQDCYIGSTEDVRMRRMQHKSSCNNENSKNYNLKVYQFIRANGGWDNFEMVQIGSVWNKATKSLVEIEQDYIDTYKSNLNCKRAYTSEEQKKEYNNQQKKEYYQKNKNKICELMKVYRHKNKNKISEKFKAYRINNRYKISERKKVKFTCECGSTLRKEDKARHFKSIKHKSFVNSLVELNKNN